MSRPPRQRETNSERHEHHIHQEKSKTEWVLETFIALMVLGTFTATSIAAYWTSQQWEVANDLLTTTRDTEVRQLRAYVGIAQRGIENFGEPNQTIKLSRKNYGVTPAIDLGMSSPNIAVVSSAPGAQFSPILCSPVPERPPNTFALFPGQEALYEIRGPLLTNDQVAAVRKGTDFVLLLWGALYYKDTFGNSRCTRYCFSFKGQDMAESDADICLQHNDSY